MALESIRKIAPVRDSRRGFRFLIGRITAISVTPFQREHHRMCYELWFTAGPLSVRTGGEIPGAQERDLEPLGSCEENRNVNDHA